MTDTETRTRDSHAALAVIFSVVNWDVVLTCSDHISSFDLS